MDTLPAPVPADLTPAIDALARRYRRANGPVMAVMNRFGGGVEAQMAKLPPGWRARAEGLIAGALNQSLTLAGRGPDLGRHGPMTAAVAAGAAGGAGGLATSLAELPVTVTLILSAIRAEARAAGFDPDTPDIRAECLRVFASGSPLAEDDGVNTSFLGARMTLTGPALQRLIATVAPRLAAVLGQKLAAQAVPVLGAVAGAGLNAAFLSYYREMAAIRFALLALAEHHGAEAVTFAFARAATPARVTKA
jgi:hypothetical protein